MYTISWSAFPIGGNVVTLLTLDVFVFQGISQVFYLFWLDGNGANSNHVGVLIAISKEFISSVIKELQTDCEIVWAEINIAGIISSRSDFLLQTDWKFMLRTLMGLLTLFEMSLVSLRSCLDDSGNFGEEVAAGTPGLLVEHVNKL
jgi:hypothetical protein